MAPTLRVALYCFALLPSLFLSFPTLAKSQNRCLYSIKVKTSWDEGSGTNSKVHLHLFSKTGRNFVIDDLAAFGKMELGHEYFKRDSLDLFEVVKECLKPCKIFVSIDGAGKKPEWHLDYIEIKITGTTDNTFLHLGFPISYWLAAGFSPTLEYC